MALMERPGCRFPITLNDVCCYVPAWLGASASILLGLLASECSGSWGAGIAASLIMSVIPAHIMRSVGGGYDNESVAMTVMCATFYFWVRALREDPKVQRAALHASLLMALQMAWQTVVGLLWDDLTYGLTEGLRYVRRMVIRWLYNMLL